MNKLDIYDKKLIYELDKKSNLPISTLAKKLRRSKQFVSYRMKNLEEKGIITRYTAIVDMAKLGYFTFRIYIKLRKSTLKDRDEFVEFVKKNYSSVWTICRMHGKYDFAVFLGVKSVMEFHEIWDGILFEYKNRIKKYHVSIYSPIYNFNRNFLYTKKEERTVRVYGKGPKTDYDELDWKIIEEYAPNVRQTYLDIGKKLKVSGDTIRNRIKRLEEKKIITGYKIGLNLQKLGFTSFRVDLSLRSTKENNRILEYCKNHKNIYQRNKTIGNVSFELEVIVKNIRELEKILDEFQIEFRKVIDSIEFFGFSTFHILKYIPD